MERFYWFPKRINRTLCGLFAFSVITAQSADIALQGPEVARLDWNTRSMRVGDVNADGRLDLLLINNDTLKIDCLIQRDGKTPSRDAQQRRVQRNRWEPVLEDSRFDRDTIVTGVTAYDLALGDFNRDGRMDLAFTGSVDALTVCFQQAEGKWSERWTFSDAEPLQWGRSLDTADMNNDGRLDLVMLAKEVVLIFIQNSSGQFEVPVRYRIADTSAVELRLMDFNGDGLSDLFYQTGINQDMACVLRLQQPDGKLGPEFSFPVGGGFLSVQPFQPGEKPSFVYLDQKTRVVRFFQLEQNKTRPADIADVQPQSYSVLNNARQPALFTQGDFNGDGLTDIIAGDPRGAQCLVYLQKKEGVFSEGVSFPSLQNLSGVGTLNYSQSKRQGLVVVSSEEGLLGVSLLDATTGRLSFPESLPVEGTPIVIATALGNTTLPPDFLALVVRRDKNWILQSRRFNPEKANWEILETPIVDIKRDPKGLRLVDINADGRLDLLLDVEREATRFFIQSKEGLFAESFQSDALRKGALQKLSFDQISMGSLVEGKSPGLLLGMTGFLRQINAEKDRLDVVDQVNARDSELRVLAPFMCRFPSEENAFCVFYNSTLRQLEAYLPDEKGVYRFQDYRRSVMNDIEGVSEIRLGQGPNASIVPVIFGRDRFWVLPILTPSWSLKSIGKEYETDLKDIKYSGVMASNLDTNGLPEVVLIDGVANLLEVLEADANGDWMSVLHFTVFDRDIHYQSRQVSALEPREIQIADVTSDGRDDILLLVHDRVLIYTQGSD
jgi:hypothetical protein